MPVCGADAARGIVAGECGPCPQWEVVVMDTQGVLRPFVETVLSVSPYPFFLQFFELLAGALNAILGAFGGPALFRAL